MKSARVVLCVGCLLAMVGLALAGVALGQDDPDSEAPAFEVVQRLGRERPRGIQYDPNYDQMVMVDPAGRLVLVDAATFAVRHVLYESGTYSIYRFSHNGRWLALGIDRRVELWDTQTGELSATAEPEEALSIPGPLQFADDDALLMITALTPAPAALRQSENDTALLPYLWDLPAARGETFSTLPATIELYPFYDYRNGFVLGPNDKVLTGLSQRLQVMDVADTSLPILSEIPSQRREPDPIDVWFSLRGESMYVQPIGSNTLVQVDTTDGTLADIPVGRELGYSQLATLDPLVFGDQARLIGEPHSRQDNSFLRLLLGEDYRRQYG
ncbi:MAG: hypothetical protein GYB65_06035, partial [Chloroflexi bacterium]|nr:hypothetical protein [Chloroflexota bacterium]